MTEEQRILWTEEALELLRSTPEANPSLATTETAAWRAGFVRGYLAASEEAFERNDAARGWD